MDMNSFSLVFTTVASISIHFFPDTLKQKPYETIPPMENENP